MADLDVGLSGLGGKVRAHVTAVPPFWWVGVVALAAVVWLSWQSWAADDMDTSSWTDPEQPPANIDPTASVELGGGLARGRRTVGPIPGAC